MNRVVEGPWELLVTELTQTEAKHDHGRTGLSKDTTTGMIVSVTVILFLNEPEKRTVAIDLSDCRLCNLKIIHYVVIEVDMDRMVPSGMVLLKVTGLTGPYIITYFVGRSVAYKANG